MFSFLKWLPALALIALMAGCGPSKNVAQNDAKKYLPKGITDIWLGMTLEEYKAKRPFNPTNLNDEDFRLTYLDQNPQYPGVTAMGYYFDKDGPQPLYEVIVIFTQESERDRVATETFGQPNVDGKEWRIERPNSFDIRAWKFKNKLIITGIIPNTEWAEE